MATDSIFIEKLSTRTTIGIADWEREILQDITVSLVLTLDISKAAHTDDIKYATNYKTISKNIINLIENSKFFLIEKLAHEVAKFVIKNYNISGVLVRLEKPGALRFSSSVGVEIFRTPEDFMHE